MTKLPQNELDFYRLLKFLSIVLVVKFCFLPRAVHMHHRARKCLVRAERDFLYYERACNIVSHPTCVYNYYSNDVIVSIENVWV